MTDLRRVQGAVEMAEPAFRKIRFDRRLVNWIWHVRGTVPLSPGLSGDSALDRLDPLFRTTGTKRERDNRILAFTKKDPAAQDKMSVFNSGVLKIERAEGGFVLRYHLISKALLFCFILPFVFLAFAQFTVTIGKFDKARSEAAEKAKKGAAEKKKDDKDYSAIPMSPIDKLLGAPTPDKPKKGDKEKDDEHSPTTALVFAGLFAFLYVIGRILEARSARKLFQGKLAGDALT